MATTQEKQKKKPVEKNPRISKKEDGGTLSAKTNVSSGKTAPSSDFAVIATGGKQYRVAVGDVISIEKLPGDLESGSKVSFEKVLLKENKSATTIGTPYIAGALVEGTLEEAGKGKKVMVVRYKSKTRQLKTKGHRQPYMKVKITKIQ